MPRNDVITVLQAANAPLTPGAIVESLRQKYPEIRPNTVYVWLHRLQETGDIEKGEDDGNTIYYLADETTAEPTIDDTRTKILKALIYRQQTQSQISRGENLSSRTVNYHVKALLAEKAIEIDPKLTGGREKFYRPGPLFAKYVPEMAGGARRPPPFDAPAYYHSVPFHAPVLGWPGPERMPVHLVKAWGPASKPPEYVQDAQWSRSPTSTGWLYSVHVPIFGCEVLVEVCEKKNAPPTMRFALPYAILGPSDPLKEREEHIQKAQHVVNAFFKAAGLRQAPIPDFEPKGQKVEHPVPGETFPPGFRLITPEGEVYSTDMTGPEELKDHCGPQTTFLGYQGPRMAAYLQTPEIAQNNRSALLKMAERADVTDAKLDTLIDSTKTNIALLERLGIGQEQRLSRLEEGLVEALEGVNQLQQREIERSKPRPKKGKEKTGYHG